MLDKEKNWIFKKINAYFLFVALAFSISAYLLLLDNSSQSKTNVTVLISPNNVKTALYLDNIKENILLIVEKKNLFNKEIILKAKEKSSLIEIEALGRNEAVASNLAENSTREILSLISKHYDVKNDLTLEIVAREIEIKTSNQFVIILESILFGLVLSFLVQIVLDLAEKVVVFFLSRKKIYSDQRVQAKKELDNFFKLNREKIQRLSLSFPAEKNIYKTRKNNEQSSADVFFPKINPDILVEYPANFKKAASPFNLPIAQEDLNKIVQSENEINQESLAGREILASARSEAPTENISADELKSALEEPTEEEFKKRLNQLLGNKINL